jgi:nucleoside 2-deoxyribosyltransferase
VEKEQRCPICNLEDYHLKVLGTPEPGLGLHYTCPRCGEFSITRFELRKIEGGTFDPKVIAWIRDVNERGEDKPNISFDYIKELEKNIPDYGPADKQLLLLRNIERMTKYPGNFAMLVPEFDYPLAWASREEEFQYYVNSLVKRGLLVENVKDGSLFVQISPEGWNYLHEYSKKAVISEQVFVAMSFSPDLKHIYDKGICPAVDDAGYKPYRVDREPHADRIDAKIMTEIKNSKFLIADVTGQKQGVYFEAGYAMGLGIPVLWSVKKSALKKVHFDTRQYRHIVWENAEQLKEQLYYLICAVIGKNR